MDQHHDGLDAARLQLGHQRVHCLGLVAEFEAGGARRRDDVWRALQGKSDEGHRNALEFPDLVRRKHGLSGALLDRAGGQVMEFRALEGMRSLAFVDRMAAAVLHPQQFVLAFVELVIADGGKREPHHRQRLDGRLVMEHRREKRAGADQVAGRHEDGIAVPFAELPDQRRQVLGAAGRDDDLLRPVLGIGDPYAARRRVKIAVEIVDRENSQIDGISGLGLARRGEGHCQRERRQGLMKRMFHEATLRCPRNDLAKRLFNSSCGQRTP